MTNAVLQRARARGVNFGGPAGNTAGDFNPPYAVKLFLNTGYNELLSRTQQSPTATLEVSFPTTASAEAYSLNPIPPNGPLVNPAALRVYEMIYQQLGGIERYIEGTSSDRFRRYSGNYVRRYANFGPMPRYWTQSFGLRQMDLFPGTVAVGDVIILTITPDPQSSPAACPASNGGVLVNDSDVPLVPPQFHMALVDYALSQFLDAGGQTAQRDVARQRFEDKVNEAIDFGSSTGEGDPEQVIGDVWAPCQ